MDIQSLLQGIPACACGKSHECPIQYAVIEADACNRLPEIVRTYRHILLVADRNTFAVGGERVQSVIGDRIEDVLIYETDGVLIPNEAAIETMQAHVTDKIDLILGIGSGVINDLCKQVSFQNGLPYGIVATAPSMDGYASKGAALILGGMKVTLNANVPMAIVGDVNILKDAPFEMIQAGYGDIIGKYSCLCDWRLSAVVNGEYLCEDVVRMTEEAVEETVRLSDGLLQRDPVAIGALMEALVAVGILMAYVGNSRPASGSEHHLSHHFEIVGILRREPYFAHGIDVCHSAIETAKLREELLRLQEVSDVTWNFDEERYEADIRRIYTDAADEVLALQKKMGWYSINRLPIYREKWQEIREVLQSAPKAERMLELTERIGLSHDAFLQAYGEEKLADAKLYAKDLKDRYSVLWMYYDLLNAGNQ